MVQSPSWEANWFAASQEFPRISRNPKVHYRTHKRPPPVSIVGQPNPVHIPTSHLLQIHPNIIHPSTPRSPQWCLSFRFPHQEFLHPPSPHPYASSSLLFKIRLMLLLDFSREQLKGFLTSNVSADNNSTTRSSEQLLPASCGLGVPVLAYHNVPMFRLFIRVRRQ